MHPYSIVSKDNKTILVHNVVGIKKEDLVVVSLMPCIAKKQEAKREVMKLDDTNFETDYSLSAKEFAGML